MALNPVSDGDPHAAAHNEERAAINQLQTDVSGAIQEPGAPILGELLRFDGTNWGRTTTRLFEGTGSPEGVVAAPPGSRYVNTDTSGGAAEWIKVTGDGTAGWSLLFGDTGFRDVSGLVQKRSTAVVNNAILRRYGDVVDLYLDLTTPTNTDSPWDVIALPSGFRPPVSRYGGMQDNKEGASGSTAVQAGGNVQFFNIVANKRDRWTGTWLTKDVWPSALPGVAI